ncbi:MAG: phosphodiester glycosidase family protein [Clostridia bacterium]|nr:phosphodiester glycosidase family protein [Clostridia bacterium]
MNRNNLWQRWMAVWRRLAHPAQIAILALMDILLIGGGLCVFALFHHVLPRTDQSMGIVSSREAAQQIVSVTAQPTSEADGLDGADEGIVSTADSTVEPLATPDPVGYFGTKFADKFTDGEVIDTVDADGTAIYQSANLNITGTKYEQENLIYYVEDIYIRDISSLKSAFANDKYGKGQREWPATIANRNSAIVAINGDYYSARSEGVVIRNGELYRDDLFGDTCVLYWDGTMETFSTAEMNVQAEMQKGAYQAWSFGPMLLDKDGQPMTEFDSSVTGRHPRTVIGYFEPGHYCFVAVDGRSSTSKGLTMSALSQLMYSLGCVRAYNLDGGQTSEMIWKGEVINTPYKGGRKCSDIVMVCEP